MNNKIANVIAFTVGAAIGAVATWKLLKTKYERIAQEEIDSVKEAYSKKAVKKENESPKQTETEKIEEVDANKQVLKGVVDKLGYGTIPTKEPKPYVISPDDFGDGEYDYKLVSLVYYEGDDTLVGQGDDVIGDIDSVVGLDSLMHFGDYEEDAVHVRNDRLKTDYEIFLDRGKWSEVSDSDQDEDE